MGEPNRGRAKVRHAECSVPVPYAECMHLELPVIRQGFVSAIGKIPERGRVATCAISECFWFQPREPRAHQSVTEARAK